MKTAIVTGANGFIGKATAKVLADRGYAVGAVVRSGDENTRELEASGHTRVICCDMFDYRNLSDLVLNAKLNQVDAFFHFAWAGVTGEKKYNPDVQICNIRGTCDAVRAASELQAERFIFPSSIAEHEIAALMTAEETPGPGAMYGAAKAAAGSMGRILAGNLGLPFVSAITANVYGPGRISSQLISGSISKLLHGERTGFSSGEHLYDFIYITDAAEIFARIGEQGKANETYYVGNRNPRKLKDFLLEMGNIVSPGTDLGIGERPFRGAGLDFTAFDTSSSEEKLHYTPQVSFAEGIKRTMAWIRQQDEKFS